MRMKGIGERWIDIFFEKRCHYSIRKFAIGAASVMIGASIFGAGMVQAAETEGPAETEGTSNKQAQPLDKLPADIAAAIEKAETATTTGIVKLNQVRQKVSLKILEKQLQNQLKLLLLRKKQLQNQQKLPKKK